MKLISTTNFVLEQKEHIKEADKLSFFEIQNRINEFYDKTVHHATQMKRVLEKRMFVPTDNGGNVLFKGFYPTGENTVSNGEIEIIFGNLITLMIHRNYGSEGITKEKMFIEDLVDYNLTITDGVQGNNI